MPLLDHFHSPLTDRRTWDGFHTAWANSLADQLNEDRLGPQYFADANIHLRGGGVEVEADVVTLTEPNPGTNGHAGTTLAVAPAWVAPAPTLVIPTCLPDEIEVQVFSTRGGATLVAAIELVSPANKDRPDTRDAFTAKCVAYLTRGVGIMVIDVVTDNRADLHRQLLAALGHGSTATDGWLAASSYRPARTVGGAQLAVWHTPLAVGGTLPTLPLGLRNAGVVPVDLEAAYLDACRRRRIT